MTQHYSLKNFLRHAPNALLDRYFQHKGVQLGLDFTKIKETKIDPVADALDALDEPVRQDIETDFTNIHMLANEAGYNALRQELQQSSQVLDEKPFIEAAFICFFDYPDIFAMARNGTLRDLIRALAQSDDGHALISHENIRAWEPGEFDAFSDARLIAPFAAASSMTCPGCEEACFMPVQIRQMGTAKAFIICETRDDMGRVPVNADDLRRWDFSFDNLAEKLCKIIDSPAPAKNLILDSCAYAGNCQTTYGQTDVFLVRNAAHGLPDNPDIRQSARYVALCLNNALDLPIDVPCIDLSTAIQFQNGKLYFNKEAVEKALSRQKPAAHENLFRREGASWTVQFQGQPRSVKHTNGMLYLAYLLNQPNQRFHASLLEQLTRKSSVHETPLESMDGQGMAALTAKAKQLRQQEKDAKEQGNRRKADDLADEQEKIATEILKMQGKGGKARTGGDAGDKARQRVQKAIGTALDNIKNQHKTLHDHLHPAIETGFDCIYRPAVLPKWNIFYDVKP